MPSTPSEAEIRAIVRRVIESLQTGTANASSSSPAPQATKATGKRRLISVIEVDAAPAGGSLTVPAGTLITPLARDRARERNVRLIEEGKSATTPPRNTQNSVAASRAAPTSKPSGGNTTSSLASSPEPKPETRPSPQGGNAKPTVAIGADHGGYPLKQQLIAYLGELGYAVQDCGTQGTDAVDYPDFAYAVARLVAEGQAQFGIVVDGAGIGSCMAANKVPGVRAALCYDVSTAMNSREHNNANVLTLGGGLIGTALARQIVKIWLETPFGGGRHAKRVDKIMAIEKRYLKGQGGS